MTLCRCQHSLRCVQEQQRRRRRVSALPALQGAEAAASSCTCTATCKAGIAIGAGSGGGNSESAWAPIVRVPKPAQTGECDGAARRAALPALTGCPDCARDGASYAKNRTSKSRREVPQPVVGASRALLVPAVVLAFAPFGAGPKPPLPPPPRARVGRVPPRPTPFLRQAAREYTVNRSPPS